jgi:pyruvate/2-oxoglutarate dehydrogenase complex dihydrolipoamide dehydrogenase (E3) component
MQEMRRMRAGLSHHDSANRFAGLGVDVFLGQGRFVGPDAIEVTPWETASSDSQPTPVGRLRFHRAIIATGARPSIPTLPGIEHVSVLTNENVFSLEELPGRLGVLGGGPIGVELAQAFARMGSQVTLINRGPRILSRDDPDAAAIVGQQLIDDGIDLQLNCHDITFESQSDGSPATVRWRGKDGGSHSAVVDHLLVAAGRVPNVEGLGLDSANVAFDVLKGVLVDDGLQTTNPRIFAAGDVCSRWKFTHAADFQARTALRNALFPSPFGFGRARVSRLVIPWCTYSSPELAQVGLTGDQAARQGVAIDTYELPFAGVDRAVLENSTTGFTRVHVHQGTDRIVGATIVGDRAGELIGQFSFAIRHKLGLGSFAQAIYPYPTVAEAVRKMGDIQQRSRLTPTVKAWLAKWWAWQVS